MIHSNGRILTISPGDFSFARSLITNHHPFRTITATTLESREELLDKHPQAEAYIDEILSSNQTRTLDANSAGPDDTKSAKGDSRSPSPSSAPESHPTKSNADESPTPEGRNNQRKRLPRCVVHYTTDATKLVKHSKLRRRKFSKIVFNFPHVGGKSTDVNRQVRHNQQMLVSFLGQCKALLAPPAGSAAAAWDYESGGHGVDGDGEGSRKSGSILITLFEGEPYTLWNIRDLARSVDLECRRSWKFDWAQYKGYRHARTLGNLKPQKAKSLGASRGREEESQGGESEDMHADGTFERRGKKRKDGWRGEERSARTYEFGLKDITPLTGGRRRKRNADDDSSEDD